MTKPALGLFGLCCPRGPCRPGTASIRGSAYLADTGLVTGVFLASAIGLVTMPSTGAFTTTFSASATGAWRLWQGRALPPVPVPQERFKCHKIQVRNPDWYIWLTPWYSQEYV